MGVGTYRLVASGVVVLVAGGGDGDDGDQSGGGFQVSGEDGWGQWHVAPAVCWAR